MNSKSAPRNDIWLASGVRTPFSKIDGALSDYDAIQLSVPLAQQMVGSLRNGALPDFTVWGTVVPNLTWSNIAREILMDAGVAPTVPAFSTIMACSTSMVGAIEAAGMIGNGSNQLALVGGVESMSNVQIGLPMKLSEWVKKFQQARSIGKKLSQLADLALRDVRLYIPAVTNRTSGLSMGEHTEITVKEWEIGRAEQDALSLRGHQRAVAGWESGFFDDLVIPVGGATRDTIPRADTSLERLGKLQPAFDKTSGKGTLTAGNSSPLTDGASSIWVASTEGLNRLPSTVPKVRLVDFELAAVDFRTEGLLMAPAFAIPRLLARHQLAYEDVGLWEIHEAFSGQVLFHIKAMEDAIFLKEKAKVDQSFGKFPFERLNPNGGSVALGHPFGATGGRILSQAVKELALMPIGTYAIVSICADGGQGSVMLLQNA
ncbi:3-ketoacyl-CoA thiolase [Collimonas arenae]|uniref:3-ketoacyl-CoA thiolase n=1 Tax=Collimonas arenae TaxID=279058 RepID=A0A0A1F9E0_9BURK|nr:acetyl-CoA C-acyltransferase [Collimonas arenae]AIY39482.1 3-ketoacyl-CoA thiolase [Collimonas arenae]